MTSVCVRFVLYLPGDCDDAIARVFNWLPWVLLREHFRRAGVVKALVSAEGIGFDAETLHDEAL